MMIKDLKNAAEGTEVKGFPLLIKTARKPFKDAEGTTFQEVVFMDSSGEMTGHILLECIGEETQGHHAGSSAFHLWKSKTNICIMDGIIQSTDERKKEAMKLVVYSCFDAATPLTFDQNQDLQAEDWKQMRQDEIKGKVRHGLTCAFIQSGQIKPDITSGKEHIPKSAKAIINEITDFILTGE